LGVHAFTRCGGRPDSIDVLQCQRIVFKVAS
jgi:hypothetical protein